MHSLCQVRILPVTYPSFPQHPVTYKNMAMPLQTLVGNVGDISATFRPETPRSHNLGDIWNVADNVTGPLW